MLPVYLFQSNNHDSGPTSFCLSPASLSYGALLSWGDAGATKQTQTESERQLVEGTAAPRPLRPASEVKMYECFCKYTVRLSLDCCQNPLTGVMM